MDKRAKKLKAQRKAARDAAKLQAQKDAIKKRLRLKQALIIAACVGIIVAGAQIY